MLAPPPTLQGPRVFDELSDHPLPRLNERIMLTVWNYKNSQRDTWYFEEFVVTKVLHLPHAEYPAVHITTRKLTFFERLCW